MERECEAEKLPMKGPIITVDSLSYSVSQKKTQKTVLEDINVCFLPGELHFILGASGSGKSSLLDCLMGMIKPKQIEGRICLDGFVPNNDDLHELIGYVEQVETVMPELTIRENLMFSAELRLPQLLSRDEKEKIVDETLQLLALQNIADSKVGSSLKRGISGGEKKRASIGMELVTRPGALVLDEPTTGLDSATSYSIMTHLKSLADSGNTVICALHQPRFSFFKLCDRLTLLSKGRTVYHGKASNAVNFFSDNGFVCEQYNNPPDFFMDVIEGCELYGNRDCNKGPSNTINSACDRATLLSQKFKSSELYRMTKNMINNVASTPSKQSQRFLDRGATKPNFNQQFIVVARRAMQAVLRSPMLLLLTLKSNILLALLVGTFFFQLKLGEDGIENRAGAFFFITMNVVYMNTSTIGHFQAEKSIFIHEKMNRYYSVTAYFLGKVACHLLPMQVVPTLAFGSIAYWMIGLRPGLAYFLKFLMVLCTASITSASMGFFFGTLVSKTTVGNLLFSLLNTLMLVGAGFLIKLEDMGVWTKWLSHVSIFRHIMEALNVNEFSGNELYVQNPSLPFMCSEAESYLLKKGYGGGDPKTAETRVWICTGMLLKITVLCLFGTYLNLRKMKRA